MDVIEGLQEALGEIGRLQKGWHDYLAPRISGAIAELKRYAAEPKKPPVNVKEAVALAKAEIEDRKRYYRSPAAGEISRSTVEDLVDIIEKAPSNLPSQYIGYSTLAWVPCCPLSAPCPAHRASFDCEYTADGLCLKHDARGKEGHPCEKAAQKV